MARILIVGCGGRGQVLARQLTDLGHTVRGTTRSEAGFDAIRAAGAEPYLGDPDRIMTLMDALAGTTIVAYLMGSAAGDNVADLHAGRLRMLCEKVVDTPVRGLVYEATGTVDAEHLQNGEMIVRQARATWNIPVAVIATDPEECERWTADATTAVTALLAT